MVSHPWIAANWKMHKTIGETKEFIAALIPQIQGAKAHVLIAPPFTAIAAAAASVKGTAIRIGAQNINEAHEGAFTGEISGKMVKDAGASFVILGHSERRQLFGEGNGLIHRKMKRAIEEGLTPLLCVGETEEQREKGHTERVLKEQLEGCLKDIPAHFALAYEPVWAIGTGKTATAEMAQEAHGYIRTVLHHLIGKENAQATPILYGGSVKPDNASLLLSQKDINGALIGGAALKVESFVHIIKSV